jgi:Tol biopolymer transport system component
LIETEVKSKNRIAWLHEVHYENFPCFILFVFVLSLSGCSIEVAPPSTSGPPVADTTEPGINPTPASTALSLPTRGIPEQSAPVIPSPTAGKVPTLWSSLALSGTLIYTAADNTLATLQVQSLNLATGDLRTIFQLPPGGWADGAVVSPDQKSLLIAYSPPMTAPYGGLQSIYTLPMDSSGLLEVLITPPTDHDQYLQPVWSPDEKYIYFAHINYETMATFEIMRMAYPDGSPEKVVGDAYWPRVSDDSTLLAYVALNPDTGVNQLSLANADGSDAHPIPVSGLLVPEIVDVPMVSPDNGSILFSSPTAINAFVPSWTDKLFGVDVAHADGSLASDWWSVPVSGGKAKQLTNIELLALYGAYSPDRKHIASFSSNGIFVMKPDGTELTMIVKDVGGIVGTVNWLP